LSAKLLIEEWTLWVAKLLGATLISSYVMVVREIIDYGSAKCPKCGKRFSFLEKPKPAPYD
jgi:hypothetical protein